MAAVPPSDVLKPDLPVQNVGANTTFGTTTRVAKILNRFQPSQETVVLLLAVLIGGGTGMGVVTFHYLIELIHSLMLENVMGVLSRWGAWTLACIPTLGGLLVGLMRWRWRDFGPSISTLLSSTQQIQDLSPLRPVTRMVAASISLGTGASLGPEGPSVEVGASFGVLLSQVLQVSQERQRLLLGAGAAAGLAAGFNAPIAGVFFALEVVLGTTFATSAVSVVLLAAVVAALIAQIGLGAQPAFALPAYEVRSPLELPLYLGLGLFASLISIAYVEAIKLAQRCFKGEIRGLEWFGQVPIALQPIIGGICVGCVALALPQIMGIGYETIEAMLRDVEFSLKLLIVLLVVKLLMTAISLGSGLVGGLFAPAMFLGASLGAAYGKVLAVLLPFETMNIAAPPAYAMVGMAAVLAASARAPLTSILLLFELTRDYRIVLPLMAAVGLSVWLIDRLRPRVSQDPKAQPIDLAVKQNHLDLLKQIPVAEAMHHRLLCLSGNLSVLEAGITLTDRHFHSALVVDEDERLLGIVTLQDINRAILQWQHASTLPLQLSGSELGRTGGAIAKGEQTTQNPANPKLKDICTREILSTYADESTAEALSRMAARGLHQLPVVDRENPNQVVGLLEREGIDLACSLAQTRETLRNLNVPSEN
jgi:H+/Cl- antiporter ClcA/CBS domain-containing protein